MPACGCDDRFLRRNMKKWNAETTRCLPILLSDYSTDLQDYVPPLQAAREPLDLRSSPRLPSRTRSLPFTLLAGGLVLRGARHHPLLFACPCSRPCGRHVNKRSFPRIRFPAISGALIAEEPIAGRVRLAWIDHCWRSYVGFAAFTILRPLICPRRQT